MWRQASTFERCATKEYCGMDIRDDIETCVPALATASQSDNRREGREDPLQRPSRWTSWFRRRQAPGRNSAYPSSELSGAFAGDYEELARDACAKYGIDGSEFRIHALQIGQEEGKLLYAVLLTSVRASIDGIARAQLLAPIVERRIQMSGSSIWLGDHTAFAGVWARWPSGLKHPDELRAALTRCAKGRAGSA